ncbi:MAG: Crp/Fnr family transcriptional regulator [Kaistella sp.]
MVAALQHIYQHPAFSDADLGKIFGAHKEIRISKGEFLLKENEVATEYYILEKGLVRAFVHDLDHNEITTEFFTENEIVIIPSSLFQKIPALENVQSITDSVLWKISYDDFQELFHEIQGLREWGRAWFSYQLFTMKRRSLEMITQTASERYLGLLEEKTQIIQFAPLKQIASYLGITDTSLSRIRKEIVSR